MKYDSFEDLPVWQAAADFGAAMFDWTDQTAFRGRGDLADQLQRAALSISNNIAEGFERGTTAELLQFLYYARGSAGEVRSMLDVMLRVDLFASINSDIPGFQSQCLSISRQLRGWANSLQNSEIKGQRHLNDQSRLDYENRERSQTFQRRLDKLNSEAREKREADARAARATRGRHQGAGDGDA